MSRSELNISRWLEAHSDRSADLTTLSRNALLADVNGDGDFRLVITDLKIHNDMRSRLKVYKGTLLVSDQVLQGPPSCIISFYADILEPKIPAIGVACGSQLFIYKNNKPFFKFQTLSSPVTPLEIDVWRKLSEGNNKEYHDIISDLKTIPYNSLSSRSQCLLTLQPSKIEEFVKSYGRTEPIRIPPITCMTTINKNNPDQFEVSCPIIATEFGTIFTLDPQNFTILGQANVCNIQATPFILVTSGLYDVDYKILIATRENHVCILRRGWIEGKSIIQQTSNIVDMIFKPGDNHIILAAGDQMIHCYTKKGQRLWSSKLINHPTCLCLVPLHHISTHLVAVGLKGGAIHLYQGRTAVDFTSAPDSPSVIMFGQLGQEEHVMVIITIGGTLNFKILKRTADFNSSNQDIHSLPSLQAKPLPLPKRSKLFLEQSMRERQNAIEMHQNFQQDLVRLRLTAARALVQNLTDQTGIGNEKEQIKLSAKVLGLGPKFTLILSLENMSNENAMMGLMVVFHVRPMQYQLSSYIVKVPLIPPNLVYKIETKVKEILDSDNTDHEENDEIDNSSKQIIKVFVIKINQSQQRPVLAATITMPPTELIAYM